MLDPTFHPIFDSPYFSYLQGGDYHVFPDGRVLLTGEYLLSDSVRGFVGQYNLVWITNTGYLDTTRVHRQANGPLWEFSEMPDGRFICTCSCSQYDGQPVDKLFRIEADGSLDTSFHTGFSYALTPGLIPLPDGRFYAGGWMRHTDLPDDTLRLTRVMQDGSLDPTFNSPTFGAGELPGVTGAVVSYIYPWSEGRLIVSGYFQTVNGLPRGGICMVDSTGQVLEPFAGTELGSFVYQGFTYASIDFVTEDADGNLLICGAYTGFSDGTVNDTLQRFVSRLLVQDMPTSVTEAPPAENRTHFGIQPNPANGLVRFNFETMDLKGKDGTITVREVTGKVVATLPMHGPIGQQVWDTRQVAPGTYLVEFRDSRQMLHAEKLIVQR
ncbi:MAG: hypothetical protein K8H89_11425 [Flavobacteriales bacterium]|nr:hypothetical protein [Flavobacteriales bacterium]MCB0757942.1 delta-60 repeat domain-containing protein [Flavobacteriales bacterium]